MPARYLDTAGLALRAGLSAATVRKYRSATPHLVPEPDVLVGELPGWLPATVDAWLAQRPGRTGRPPRPAAIA